MIKQYKLNYKANIIYCENSNTVMSHKWLEMIHRHYSYKNRLMGMNFYKKPVLHVETKKFWVKL